MPDALRQKTTIRLNAEIMGTLSSLAGPEANTKTVLEQTFNDVDLVGRPLTIGNFVNTTTIPGLFFAVTTNTYSPYIEVGDDANPDPSQDQVIRGTDYQEVLTNFPLASQFLTGLFLDVDLSGPGGPTETYERTLVDRIGFAVRQNGGSPNLNIDTSGPPILSNQDIYTINVLPGLQNPAAATLLQERATALQASLAQQVSGGNTLPIDAAPLLQQFLVTYSRLEIAQYLILADAFASNLARATSVVAYFDQPRITIFTTQVDAAQGTLNNSIDLRTEQMRVEPAPGQNIQTAQQFNFTRGLMDSAFEQAVIPTTPNSHPLSSFLVLEQAEAQGVSLALLTSSNASDLDTLNLPADAKGASRPRLNKEWQF